MAEEIKPRKRIKVKVKPGKESPEIPEGYVIDPSRSKKGKEVYVRMTEKTINAQPSQYRETTSEEKKRMEAGTFYGPNVAQYREDKPVVLKEKEEMIVKTKEPKYKESGPTYTAKERRESRQAQKMMKCAGRKFGSGCRVGRY